MTNLYRVVCQQAPGCRADVTAVVMEFANASVETVTLALSTITGGGDTSTALNCGYGHGYFVREVLAAGGRAHGSSVPFIEEPRRAGDPPSLIAISDRIRDTLGWAPRHDDLDFIAHRAGVGKALARKAASDRMA